MRTPRPPTMAALMALLLSMVLASCDYVTVVPPSTPAPRAGSSSEGSARWAFDLAREKIEAEGFNADSELYVIQGATVWNDGRLPANRGSWQFVFWSQARQLDLEIEVSYDAEIRANTESKTSPPTSRPPMPADWRDSITIFQAAPAFSSSVVDGALTNLAAWPAEPGAAFWAVGCILTRDCLVYYVRWDGVYLGDRLPWKSFVEMPLALERPTLLEAMSSHRAAYARQSGAAIGMI